LTEFGTAEGAVVPLQDGMSDAQEQAPAPAFVELALPGVNGSWLPWRSDEFTCDFLLLREEELGVTPQRNCSFEPSSTHGGDGDDGAGNATTATRIENTFEADAAKAEEDTREARQVHNRNGRSSVRDFESNPVNEFLSVRWSDAAQVPTSRMGAALQSKTVALVGDSVGEQLYTGLLNALHDRGVGIHRRAFKFHTPTVEKVEDEFGMRAADSSWVGRHGFQSAHAPSFNFTLRFFKVVDMARGYCVSDGQHGRERQVGEGTPWNEMCMELPGGQWHSAEFALLQRSHLLDDVDVVLANMGYCMHCTTSASCVLSYVCSCSYMWLIPPCPQVAF
jgi:hypothetical protein